MSELMENQIGDCQGEYMVAKNHNGFGGTGM